MTMSGIPEYFGERWPSGICDEGMQVVTPAGERCAWCYVPIESGDRGQIIWIAGVGGAYPNPIHRECQLRSVMGSVAHWQGRCQCRTGVAEKPQTAEEVRQDAMDLWAWVERRRELDSNDGGRPGGHPVVGPDGTGCGPDVRGERTDSVPLVEEGRSVGSENAG